MDIRTMANAVAAAVSPIVPEKAAVKEGRSVHIDGDMICYYAGGNDDTSVAASRNILRRKVDQFIEFSGAERAVLHLTASGSAKGDRYHVATVKPYQQQRKNSRRPKNWEYLREYCQEQYEHGFKLWTDREADDGFGYISVARPDDVIATADKDMRMLSGWHMSWQTASMTYIPSGTYRTTVNVEGKDKDFGLFWFFQQMLMGDTADNIPGLPVYRGKPVGEATARKLLAHTKTQQEGAKVVHDCYIDTYGLEADARLVEQAALLWIRTDKRADLLDFMKAFAGVDDGDRIAHAALLLKHEVARKKKEIADVFATAPTQGR